jgi:hypothetical protein
MPPEKRGFRAQTPERRRETAAPLKTHWVRQRQASPQEEGPQRLNSREPRTIVRLLAKVIVVPGETFVMLKLISSSYLYNL